MSEVLENQLAQLRSVTKALDNFKKIGRNNLTPAKIRSRMTLLKENWNKCLEGHNLLLQQYPEVKRSSIPYFREEQRDIYEEIYNTTMDYMAECLEEIDPVVSLNQSGNRSISNAQSETVLSLKHLPPIKLPPFSGKIDEWENFRDRFTALIIQNHELSDFARMHFLVSSLTDGARDVVAGTPITADNFAVAWKALNSRFESKRKLIETHVAELYNLPPITRESAADLHSLLDKADRSISALKRLDRTPEDIANDILVYFVSLKLDPVTRRAWKLKIGSESNPPNYDDLSKFLSSRALALEELSPSSSSKSRQTIKANNATLSNKSSDKCTLCKKLHYLSRCPQFLNKSPSQRRELVKSSNRCFNCLGAKHSVQTCQSKFKCRTCQKRHHSLLHFDSASVSDKSENKSNASNVDEAVDNSEASKLIAMSALCAKSSPSSVLLATAKVTVRSPNGRVCEARALIDQGSEVTFISEKLARVLRLQRKRIFAQISAIGGIDADTCRYSAFIELAPRGKRKPVFTTVAFILKALTKYAPQISASIADWKHLNSLQLADDDPTGSSPIDLVIGADVYGHVIQDGVRKGLIGQPIAQRSHFGWILSGSVQTQNAHSRKINVYHCSLEQDLRRFWEIEEIPRQKILSPAEEHCEKHFQTTHSRSPDGRYVVRLPFKTTPPINIGESRSIAVQRLTSLKRRLDTNSDIKAEYNAFLAEYEQLNHMQRVQTPDALNSQIIYFPHHPVIRETSTTTRLRVVFNASSLTTNGTSLNSHLEIGPKLQTELPSILLRWRQYKYVYTADIAKMYRQILIDPRDRDYQRIVWYNHDYSVIQDYQLLTVTYGTASAPYLALRVLKQLVKDEGSAFPLAIPILQENIYVDDVLFGADDIPLLKQSREQLCTLLSRGGFHLRKWASNSSALLADIPEECHGLAGNRLLTLEEKFSVLGLSWNPGCDAFQFRVSLPQSLPNTKRKILSTIARLFDPLGWVTPVTINAKILMQELWRIKSTWDDVIPSQTSKRWESIYQNLSALNDLQIHRWTGQDHDTARCDLHGFADASNVAYAAAVYIQITSLSGEITTKLLAGKSKVAPLKSMSIPRLELSAACLLARLLEFVRSSLSMSNITCHCWTDSTVVLAWLSSHPSRWKTFVSHRVADVQSRLPDVKWRYIPSAENPADCASRGILTTDLNSSHLWWNGPTWLKLDKSEWPKDTAPPLSETPEENQKLAIHSTQMTTSWDLASRYSTWPKLIRVTAYLLRFVHKCRKLNPDPNNSEIQSQALSEIECREARQYWIRTIQSEVFSAEVKALETNQSIPRKSPLNMLQPFLDENKIIRIGGRLKHAAFSFATKHPILLAPHPIVKLIIRQAHVRSLHAGVQLTLATVRQEYWILKARTQVKQAIHQCVTCVRERAETPTQLMGDLPQARVSTPARAFNHSGVDYAGPIFTRASSGRGITSRKGYIVLFICLASKAVHLELVSSYSKEAFIDAFSRFCARRGMPSDMYSDNGTTFAGADAELSKAYQNAARNPDFQNRTAADNVRWHFIPPHAPHFGGLWEAGVRSVKHHLRRILGSHLLTYEEFSTLLCRIEACLNSRPIGPLTDTIDDYEPLTPGHFLIGSALTFNPEPSLLSINEDRLSRWQLIRQLTERFWKIWQSDYVNTLQQRIKWRQVQPSVKAGTMVLIRNPLLPPCKWELGRVTQCYPGSDGHVRVVLVRTAQSEYKRPIVKLCILPIDIEPSTEYPRDG